jgi:hypothetical protein
MSAFEYVTVLISIVLSLGIAQILTNVASLIKKSGKVILYWPHLLWVMFVLLLHVQEWWVTYELKSHTPWRLPTFLFIMAYPVNLFVLAHLLFPNKLKGVVDLKKYYLQNFKKIFAVLSLSGLFSILYNLFILNLSLKDQLLQILLILVVSIIAVKQFTNEWIHKAVSLIVMLTIIASIVIEWNVWLID